MPSQLIGLRKTLTWNDFNTVTGAKPSTPPLVAAQTSAPWKMIPYTYTSVPGSSPAVIRLGDSVTLSVAIKPTDTWVMEWVFHEPQTFQDALLHHEQGHYDISALITRDCFVDVVLLRNETFASHAALKARIDQIKA